MLEISAILLALAMALVVYAGIKILAARREVLEAQRMAEELRRQPYPNRKRRAAD